ncbi:MAG: bifunctional folylpolyglutamate synthase/dihydrofolate synthase [Ruminococcus sp.]|nr:bifunctional folylpolyglutamate synthase/dihydrofolate synthase [Ruminococcus sp.]
MNYNEAMSFVNSYSKSGKAVTDLSRARELMKRVGNPEKQLKFVHVAGTNGKGSTVEYISNALIYSGYKTGQFTSPYITHYADRIRINGVEIDENSLCEIAEMVKNSVADAEYSQFEITMAIALLWYACEKCDIVVLEAGIGGLLDCTNVIPPPVVSVITSISLDHTAILGDTVEKIAMQKAGIIKENSAVVLSMFNKESVVEIVGEKAKEHNSLLISPDETVFSMLSISAQGSRFCYFSKEYTLAMIGECQCVNAVTAIETCRYMRKCGFNISEENIEKSLENTRVRARAQYIEGNPPVIVDGGHNPDGVNNVLSYIEGINPAIAVMGMVDSKDYENSVKRVAEYCEKIFTVDGFTYNCISAEKLAETAGEYTVSEACGSLAEAVEKAKKLAVEKNTVVLVCGSLYLASEYLNNCENK